MYFGGRLHFCAGRGRQDAAESVRTLEWRGRVVTRGRQPFPDEWWDDELERLEHDDIDAATLPTERLESNVIDA